MYDFSSKKIDKRNKLIYSIAKFFAIWGYKHLAKPHEEIHDDIKRLKDKKAVFLYTGLHKSLWETTGVITSLHLNNFPIPFVGMGDNLVRGKFFQNLVKKTGVFLIKRANVRRDIVKSAESLKKTILNFIVHNTDILIFPEGTRKNISRKGKYGDFFPAAFEAMLEYERNKKEILKSNKKLLDLQIYIVPFNVDYSKIREDAEIIKESKNTPQTLHIIDSFKMLKNLGDIYITIGKPISVSANIEKNRKELAKYTREKCLDLVKILPINIVSRSILDSYNNGKIEYKKLPYNISKNIKKLEIYKDRFKGFSIKDKPQYIINSLNRNEIKFKKIDVKNLAVYELYSNYISHYFEKKKE